MKKLVSLLCIAVLLLSLSAAAFAADTEIEVMTTSIESIDPDVYEGEWMKFGDYFDLYLPTDWAKWKLTDDDIAADMFYQTGPRDESAFVSIYYKDADSAEAQAFASEASALATAEQYGFELREFRFNDEIFGYGYYVESVDMTFVIIPFEEGDAYAISFQPASDEDLAPYFANILQSLSLTESN